MAEPRWRTRAVATVAMAVLTSTARPAAATCFGDCNGDGRVTINEVIVMVDILLGLQPLSACAAGDRNHDGKITVDEVIADVAADLKGCALAPAACATNTYTYT